MLHLINRTTFLQHLLDTQLSRDVIFQKTNKMRMNKDLVGVILILIL